MDLESYTMIEGFFIVLWIMMPAYLANTIAVLTGGKYPIDLGRIHSDGNRILGDGKTWSGLVGGTLGGVFIGFSHQKSTSWDPLRASINPSPRLICKYPISIPPRVPPIKPLQVFPSPKIRFPSLCIFP